MPEDYFGEDVAARYDDDVAEMFDPAIVEPVVEFLAELAGDGAALELGIGTVSEDHLGIDEYDAPNQGLISHHLFPGRRREL